VPLGCKAGCKAGARSIPAVRPGHEFDPIELIYAQSGSMHPEVVGLNATKRMTARIPESWGVYGIAGGCRPSRQLRSALPK